MKIRVLSAICVLTLAACSGSTPSSTAPSAPPSVAPTEVATGSPASSATAECREVTHALGSACIPAEAARVVTLGCQTSLEYALALGMPVIGYDVAPWEPAVPPYLDKSLLAEATSVGSCFAPDLEAVKALDPDLIIYTFDNGNYPQVSAIAPTVVLAVGYADFRDDFKAAAELLGKSDQATAVLADLDPRIAALKDKLAPVYAGKTVSAFQTGSDGTASIYGAGSYHGALLAELGLELPPEQSGAYASVSLEQIGLLDADVGLAVYGYTDPSTADGSAATKKQFVENPLWGTLTFVQNDALHEMNGQVWGVHGIYWADAMLEDIEANLLP